MKQLVTKGIVLSRTDYGEADRIVTLLTPEVGKLRVMARGVRKIKSRLAGGIELFSISDITYMKGKSDMGTLLSARLDQHYGKIVSDIDRVQLGYDLIKRLNKVTEDNPEPEYFRLMQQAFAALDDESVDLDLIRAWFQAQLLRLAGHTPNLETDTSGQKLVPDRAHSFDFDTMCFAAAPNGRFSSSHIKVLRLLFSQHKPTELSRVDGIGTYVSDLQTFLQATTQNNAH